METNEEALHELAGKKKEMLQNLERHYCIVSLAAKDTGISRDAHYKWLERDPQYKKQVEQLTESLLDQAEEYLIKAALDGKWKAVRFFLLSKGRSRGYVLNGRQR